MAVGYGHSHIHEPKPQKKVYNRVTRTAGVTLQHGELIPQTAQFTRPVGRPRSRYTFHKKDNTNG